MYGGFFAQPDPSTVGAAASLAEPESLPGGSSDGQNQLLTVAATPRSPRSAGPTTLVEVHSETYKLITSLQRVQQDAVMLTEQEELLDEAIREYARVWRTRRWDEREARGAIVTALTRARQASVGLRGRDDSPAEKKHVAALRRRITSCLVHVAWAIIGDLKDSDKVEKACKQLRARKQTLNDANEKLVKANEKLVKAIESLEKGEDPGAAGAAGPGLMKKVKEEAKALGPAAYPSEAIKMASDYKQLAETLLSPRNPHAEDGQETAESGDLPDKEMQKSQRHAAGLSSDCTGLHLFHLKAPVVLRRAASGVMVMVGGGSSDSLQWWWEVLDAPDAEAALPAKVRERFEETKCGIETAEAAPAAAEAAAAPAEEAARPRFWWDFADEQARRSFGQSYLERAVEEAVAGGGLMAASSGKKTAAETDEAKALVERNQTNARFLAAIGRAVYAGLQLQVLWEDVRRAERQGGELEAKRDRLEDELKQKQKLTRAQRKMQKKENKRNAAQKAAGPPVETAALLEGEATEGAAAAAEEEGSVAAAAGEQPEDAPAAPTPAKPWGLFSARSSPLGKPSAKLPTTDVDV